MEDEEVQVHHELADVQRPVEESSARRDEQCSVPGEASPPKPPRASKASKRTAKPLPLPSPSAEKEAEAPEAVGSTEEEHDSMLCDEELAAVACHEPPASTALGKGQDLEEEMSSHTTPEAIPVREAASNHSRGAGSRAATKASASRKRPIYQPEENSLESAGSSSTSSLSADTTPDAVADQGGALSGKHARENNNTLAAGESSAVRRPSADEPTGSLLASASSAARKRRVIHESDEGEAVGDSSAVRRSSGDEPEERSLTPNGSFSASSSSATRKKSVAWNGEGEGDAEGPEGSSAASSTISQRRHSKAPAATPPDPWSAELTRANLPLAPQAAPSVAAVVQSAVLNRQALRAGAPQAPPPPPYVRPSLPPTLAGRAVGIGRGGRGANGGRGVGRGEGGKGGSNTPGVIVLINDANRLVGFHITPARGENGHIRRGVQNASVRGSTCGEWIETGIPILMREDVSLTTLAAQLFLDEVLRKATHTYAELTSNGRLQAAMNELQALGRVPVTLFMFNDASHVVDESYGHVNQGVLVITGAKAESFTWAIANLLRAVVTKLAGRYQKKLYISRGLGTGAGHDALLRTYSGPHEFWHAPLYEGYGHTFKTLSDYLRSTLEALGASITEVDGRDTEVAEIPDLEMETAPGMANEGTEGELGPYGALPPLPSSEP